MNTSRGDLLKAAALGVAGGRILAPQAAVAKSKSKRTRNGRKAISVPVAGGEQDNDLTQWRQTVARASYLPGE